MRIFLTFLVVCGICSCTTTQYFTVAGINTIQNDKKEFVFENDTLRITYNFNGLNAPVQVKVFNKTSQPIEIDWERSVTILNNEVRDMFPDAHLNASFKRKYRNFRVEAGISLENQKQFIPPGTSTSKIPVRILDARLPFHYFNAAKRERLYNGSGKYALTIRKLAFASEQSPFQIRSYLTITSNGQVFTYENDFYVSEVWQANGKHYHLPLNYLENGDLFYIE
jgi:hypothetical protein